MKLSKMKKLKVFTCLSCDRVAVLCETVQAGDAYEARMKAQGYHRI